MLKKKNNRHKKPKKKKEEEESLSRFHLHFVVLLLCDLEKGKYNTGKTHSHDKYKQ